MNDNWHKKMDAMKRQRMLSSCFMVALIVLFCLGAAIYVQFTVSRVAESIDEHGGLKSVVERIWEGPKR